MNNTVYIKNLLEEIKIFNKELEEYSKITKNSNQFPSSFSNITIEYHKTAKSFYNSLIDVINYYASLKKYNENIFEMYNQLMDIFFLLGSPIDDNFILRDKLSNQTQLYIEILLDNNINFNRATIPINILYDDTDDVVRLINKIRRSCKEIQLSEEELDLIINRWINNKILYKIFPRKKTINVKFSEKCAQTIYLEIENFIQGQEQKYKLPYEMQRREMEQGTFFDKQKYLSIFSRLINFIQDFTNSKQYTSDISILYDTILDISLIGSNIVDGPEFLDNKMIEYYEILMQNKVSFNRALIPTSLFYNNSSFVEDLKKNISDKPLDKKELKNLFYFWLYGELDF